jgi:uncharacterized repeat protein (TIGR01451 family)/LPXTG-motif cell wall-anchored protein
VPSGTSAATLTITTHVHAAAYPGVTNVATVGSASADLPGTADASDVVLVEPDVRLALTKSVVSQVDGRITYRIAVTNAGQSTTTDPIIVTDRLPDGLTVLSAAGPGWSCVSSASLVTCSDPIHLAPGQSAALDLITSVTAAVGRSVTNVASVSGGGAAGATRSNAATAVVAAATTDDGTGGPRAADGGSRDTATDGPAGGPGDGPALAHTGTSVLGSVVAGLLLLLLGGLALAGRRRSAW